MAERELIHMEWLYAELKDGMLVNEAGDTILAEQINGELKFYSVDDAEEYVTLNDLRITVIDKHEEKTT